MRRPKPKGNEEKESGTSLLSLLHLSGLNLSGSGNSSGRRPATSVHMTMTVCDIEMMMKEVTRDNE